jgi:hypothetical protein
MKYTYLFILLFSYLTITAQFRVEPDIIDIQIPPTEMIHTYTVYAVNESNRTENVYWMLDLDSTWIADWRLIVCDNNLCYTPGIIKCPDANPNVVAPGDSVMVKIDFLSSGVRGLSAITLRLFNEPACEGEFFVSDDTGIVQVGGTVSVKTEIESKTPYIYPNPIVDQMYINHDQFVKMVKIYDYNGRLLKIYNHSPGQFHRIGDMMGGIYMVQMTLDDNSTITDLLVKTN